MLSAWLEEFDPTASPEPETPPDETTLSASVASRPAPPDPGPQSLHPGWLDDFSMSEGSDIFGDELGMAVEDAPGSPGRVAGGAQELFAPAPAADEGVLVPFVAVAGAAGGAAEGVVAVAVPPLLRRWPADPGDESLIVQGIRQCLGRGVLSDLAVGRVARTCFRLRYIKSLQDAASSAGVSTWRYRCLRTWLSSALLLAERFVRRSFDELMAKAQEVRLHLYLDLAAFDETPLLVRETDHGVVVGPAGALQDVVSSQQLGGVSVSPHGVQHMLF